MNKLSGVFLFLVLIFLILIGFFRLRSYKRTTFNFVNDTSIHLSFKSDKFSKHLLSKNSQQVSVIDEMRHSVKVARLIVRVDTSASGMNYTAEVGKEIIFAYDYQLKSNELILRLYCKPSQDLSYVERSLNRSLLLAYYTAITSEKDRNNVGIFANSKIEKVWGDPIIILVK